MEIDYTLLIGQKFGRITIKEYLGSYDVKLGRMVLGECECGKIKHYRIADLRSSKVRSCGCLKREMTLERITKHGLYHTAIYKLWYLIKSRCYNEQNAGYYNYGAKGVRMCDEWLNNFMSFYNWSINNGWGKGLQLDKDKLAPTKTGILYCPEYCCFLTPKQNCQHRTNSVIVEYNNEMKGLAEWTDILGLELTLVRSRYKKGWSTQRIFETPCLEKFRNKRFIK